ncbi:Fe-S oxidoreductase [Pseudodesulfovibrio sp. JC047]|uniref:pyridine nucleotide-disulfide oxidoreductase/dicluster-binding protein n=1 Tax=Pseudodesulfovibrio sp. JC047 TaxID=2683199 RepID=UPI0013CF7350|nr:pyridine nucleotide-disulfide oxidoreductase/dicluster-binding protein [Pseudodesulfovibrio sp. JC047]NDV19869.1 Fe-S oxidoreductase [Pseudodesulfovibrio sp. JC047]
MEQAELRQWEQQCVQEEVPWCLAACPLHVDAKAFCALMAQQRWDKAWMVLAKTLPVPGILARLCDAPCQEVCVRKDVGGAIEMGRLERFCAENAKPVAPPRRLPSRGKSIAVFGGGLTGLCGAWELARRGFDVTLSCSVVGEGLPALPDGVLDAEVASLEKLGVVIRRSESLPLERLQDCLVDSDAAFIDSASVPEDWTVFLGEPDAMTLGTTQLGVFSSPAGESSAIMQAAAGRRAANSVERFTQGVSMVSGRDHEGPYATRLFTNLASVDVVEPIKTSGPYSEDTARDEAKRCLQCECMECVKGCEYLRHFNYYPKVYVRQVYNNESIVMGTRQANTLINSCMLCGLCETVCPEDFSMADVCLQARQTMVETGKMPQSAHEFALRDMAFADGDRCTLARHAPGESSSEYVFFPGCQLTASDPEGVMAAYGDLRDRLGAVGLMLHCCSAPAAWAGRQALAEASMATLKQQWEDLGCPRIIAACPTCLKTLRQGLPDVEILSHWSILRAVGLPSGAMSVPCPLAVNDPCAARYDPLLREDVRAVLDRMRVEMVEPAYNGELAQCCGYGGLVSEANPDLGLAVADVRAKGADEDFVTYCIMCRDMIAKTGKRAMHVYDLLYPRQDDPAARPSPGYSARRENRVRLKEQLLRDVWGQDETHTVEPYESIEFDVTDAVARSMEDRRILKSDIQKVLLQARESGTRLVNRETGYFLASFRPVVMTYWVEYEERAAGLLVHRVWCHRMKIQGAQP